MFIEVNDLKGLIVNLGSKGELLNSDWRDITELIPCIFLIHEEEQGELVKEVIGSENFIMHSGPIGLAQTIISALNALSTEYYETAFVTPYTTELRFLQEQALGSILVSETALKADDKGYIPDFRVNTIQELIPIINRTNKGYFAEACLTFVNSTKPFANSGYILQYDQPVGNRNLKVISCGRYFNKNHPKSVTHQLSHRLLRSKEKNDQSKLLGGIISPVLVNIHEKGSQIDGVTRVPPRPNDARDRLMEVVTAACNKSELPNLCSSLRCSRDYPSQKNYNVEARIANVAGVFYSPHELTCKHIVLIDDIITTSATVSECARVLFSAGVQEVTIVALAINQFSPQWREKHFLPCPDPNCHGSMQLRFQRNGITSFFGCSNYFTRKCNGLNYIDGWRNHNLLNVSPSPEDYNYPDIEF